MSTQETIDHIVGKQIIEMTTFPIYFSINQRHNSTPLHTNLGLFVSNHFLPGERITQATESLCHAPIGLLTKNSLNSNSACPSVDVYSDYGADGDLWRIRSKQVF